MNKIVFSALLFAALWLATACTSTAEKGSHHEEEEYEHHTDDITLTAQQVKAVELRFGRVEQKQLSEVVRVNGVTALNPQDKADITPLMGGTLRSITVIEGSRVARGQVVAWIENTEIVALQRDYLQSISILSQAERELQRQQELNNEGAGVAKNLQKATSDYHIAQSSVVGLKSQLRQLGIQESTLKSGKIATQVPITSPISGFVDKIYKSTGSYADNQQPIMSVVDNSRLHIDINVYEKDLPSMKVGQKVDFVLTNNPDVRLSGVIYEYASSFTDNTKSVMAHVRITDKAAADVKLIPDMYVTGTVQKGKTAVSAVPKEAVANSEGKDYIFILERTEGDGDAAVYHFERVEVMTGAEELGYTQIMPTAKLPDDATIVVKNTFYLSSILGKAAAHDH